MNSKHYKHQCRYCQIEMVNAQKLMPLSAYSKWLQENHSSPSILKCPVCGYSELDQDFPENCGYSDSANYARSINNNNSGHNRQPG